MSFSSILTLIIMLSICAAMLVFVENTNEITRNVEAEVSLIAELRPEVTEMEIQTLMQTFEQHTLIESFVFRDRYEEFHRQLTAMIGGLTNTAVDMFDDIENRLVDVFEIEATTIYDLPELANFIASLESIEYVFDVNEIAENISTVTTIIRNVMIILVLVLMILAIFLIQNTIRVTIYARQEELGIMRLVGASIGHVIFPFVVEGLIIGFIGAIIPILLINFGYTMLYTASAGVLGLDTLELVSPLPLVYQIGFTMGIISVAVSLIGSLVAVSKYALKG